MDPARRLDLNFAFEKGSFSGKDVGALVRALRFTPKGVSGDHAKRGASYSDAWLRKIEKAPKPERVFVEAIDMSPDGLRKLAAKNAIPLDWSRLLYWSLPHGCDKLLWKALPGELPNPDEVEALVRRPGFVFAHCGDSEDIRWQSEKSVEAYKGSGRDCSHLPREADCPPPIDLLDIRPNPGRATYFLDGLLLCASWRMWFGPGIFSYIPSERILSFEGARSIEQRADGVIFVELFEHPLDAEKPENRELQRRFREWTGMDYLEEHHEDYEDEPDPCFLIEDGSFPHGGDKRVTTWLDARGKPTSRSKAIFKHVIERNLSTDAKWEERVRLVPEDDAAKGRKKRKQR